MSIPSARTGEHPEPVELIVRSTKIFFAVSVAAGQVDAAGIEKWRRLVQVLARSVSHAAGRLRP
jgi:hypothetical protein